MAGLGMWLKRDVDTREVFVSWIDPGGVADRAGVAEGSVLTALATRVDAPDSSPDDPSRRHRHGYIASTRADRSQSPRRR